MEIECIARIKTEEPLLTLAITQYTIYFGGLSSTVYKHTFEDQITKFLTFNNPIRAICTDNDFLICCSYKNAIIMKNEKYIDIVENIETEIKGVDMKDTRIGIATRGCDVWLLDIKTNDENRYTERDDFDRNCSVYNDQKVEGNEREQSQCNNDKNRKDTRNTANIETMNASDTDYAEIYRIDVKTILHDHTHDVKGVKIYNDLVFTYGYDCCIKVYDNTLLENLVCDSTVWDLIFTDYIVASDNTGFLYYFDYDYKLVRKLKISNYPILKMCKVKYTIAAITNRQCVAFIKDFEIVHIMTISEYAINCIDYNEKSGTFGCVDDNGYLHVYRVKIE